MQIRLMFAPEGTRQRTLSEKRVVVVRGFFWRRVGPNSGCNKKLFSPLGVRDLLVRIGDVEVTQRVESLAGIGQNIWERVLEEVEEATVGRRAESDVMKAQQVLVPSLLSECSILVKI